MRVHIIPNWLQFGRGWLSAAYTARGNNPTKGPMKMDLVLSVRRKKLLEKLYNLNITMTIVILYYYYYIIFFSFCAPTTTSSVALLLFAVAIALLCV